MLSVIGKNALLRNAVAIDFASASYGSIETWDNGVMRIDAGISFSASPGGSSSILHATQKGKIYVGVVTFTASVAVTMNAFARASTGGEIFFQAIPGSSGTFTGSRYSVGGGGTITAGVALTATSLPGSVAGTVTAGQGSMYGDDFSGDLTVAGNVQSTSGAFGSGSSTIYIRPNGTASVTGQTTISAAGDMLVSGSVSCSTNFTSGNMLLGITMGPRQLLRREILTARQEQSQVMALIHLALTGRQFHNYTSIPPSSAPSRLPLTIASRRM
jgi:hypothetical protein